MPSPGGSGAATDAAVVSQYAWVVPIECLAASDLSLMACQTAMPLSPIPIPLFGGAPLTLGASASILGLLGALLHYGRKSGSSLIHSTALNYVLILFVMGFMMPGVDNTAHLGGFLGGYAMSAVFNPLSREKGDHLLLALALIGASFLAITYSVIHGLHLI